MKTFRSIINIMNKGTGAGGKNTTISGIYMEKKISNIINISNINKLGYNIYYQNEIYNIIDDKTLTQNYISKDLKMGTRKKPDMAFLNKNEKKIIIAEIKNQNKSGSVDEKLETGPYKLDYYREIFSKYNYKVYYIYILNNFFNNIRYNRIIDYNSKNGIRTFIYNNEEKLNDELDEYIKGL